MTQLFIWLPQGFQAQHQLVVEQYLVDSRKLTRNQWKLVLQAFDLLGSATAQQGGEVHTFRTLYRLLIENVYANPYLKKLTGMNNPEQEGLQLQAKITHQIETKVKQFGWVDLQLAPYSLYLQAYCTFWWKSFAKGYRFEMAVFRDLEDSGIRFWADDFTQSAQRYMPYDLIINDWEGDIRTSTYFLTTARTQNLKHAFYITRLWHRRRRQRVWAVIMQPNVWAAIDGETEVAELSKVSERFPEVSTVYSRNRILIVAEYVVWKQKIMNYQEHYDE